MPRWPLLWELAAVTTLGLTCSGCSLLFTKKPPPSTENLPVTTPARCTSSLVAPVVDSIIGAYQIVRSGVAINADDSAYDGNPVGINRGMDIGFGVTLATVFLTSAVYGFVVTNNCREFKARLSGYPAGDAQVAPPSDPAADGAPDSPSPRKPPESPSPAAPVP
jgi:hypothetical protein